MKINGTSNNSFQNKVLIDTFIEQISALQTDVGNLQIADDNLSQALATKANTVDINTAVNTGTLGAQTGNIKTLKVQGTGSSATIQNATIGTASIGTETVTQSNITNLEVMDVDAGTVRTGALTVENDATISGDIAVQDVSAKDITSASVNTLNVTTAEADINKLEAQNAEVTGKLEVNDLEVNGTFSGVSNIETSSIDTEDITADTAEIETLDVENIRSWVTQVMNQDQILNPPTPALGNVDTYTIELPRFDGVFLLSWEDADVVWSATVIGNGKSYGISWGSRTEQNYITDLFQYNGKLYIRVNSNGKLKYAYSTTKELGQIVIYRNMVGWVPEESLEELCDENSHLINAYPTGMAWFGPVFIPRLQENSDKKGGLNFKGSCTFSEIPALSATDPGDVWNITDEAYTDNRFVEGAGKPINVGDDIVAVEVENTDPIITPEESLDGDSCVFLNMSNGQCLALLGNSENNNTRVCIRNGLNEYMQISTISNVYSFACILEGRPGTIIALPNGYDGVEAQNSIFRSTDFGQTWTKIYVEEINNITLMWNDLYISSNREGLFVLDVSHDYGRQPFYSIDDGLTWNYFGISTPDGYAERNSVLTVLNNNTAIFNFCDSENNQKRMFYIWHNISSTDTPILTKIGEITDDQHNIYDFSQLQIDNTTVLAFSSPSRRESYRIDLSTPQMTRITDLPNDESYYGIVDGDRIILASGYISNDAGDTWTKVIEKDSAYWPENNKVYLISHNIYQYRYMNSQASLNYSEVKILPNSKVLKWDKFAAGVNYENFVARNITATESLTSSGTLEVHGVSTLRNGVTAGGPLLANFDSTYITTTGTAYESYSGERTVYVNRGEIIFGDINQIGDHDISGTLRVNTITSQMSANPVQIDDNLDVTGSTTLKDITQTGNLTQTGNETIIGTVVIGDLD